MQSIEFVAMNKENKKNDGKSKHWDRHEMPLAMKGRTFWGIKWIKNRRYVGVRLIKVAERSSVFVSLLKEQFNKT